MRHRRLLKQIDKFIEETGMGPSYFGRLAGAGTELIPRLRAGKDIHTATELKIKKFMRYYRRHGEAPPWARSKMRAQAAKARAARPTPTEAGGEGDAAAAE